MNGPRPYYRFPLSTSARAVIVTMAKERYQHSGRRVHSYRAIGRYLKESGLVDQLPSAPTIRRAAMLGGAK